MSRHLAIFISLLASSAALADVTSAESTVDGARYTVRWKASAPVTVRVSADPKKLGKVVHTDKGSGHFEIDSPTGADVRPYFFVATKTGGLRTATRQVPLEGASNFRDLGGYASANGKHVVWGQLFRSNALAELTPRDYRTVDALGIKLVCDLRTDEERGKQPTKWEGAPPEFVTSPKKESGPILKTLFASGTSVAAAREAMRAFYRRMPTLYAGENRAMFDRLKKGEVPMILHCTAGKDRSGLASALILVALGVPRATILADYALSAGRLAQGARKHGISAGLKANTAPISALPPEIAAVYEASDPEFLDAALDQIDAHWGSMNAYLDKEMGVDGEARAALQERYLE